MNKNEIKKLLKLNSDITITNIEVMDNKILISVKSTKKKVRYTRCNCFSNKVHDYLKPSRVDYLKIFDKPTYLIVYKRRFKCNNCKKSFTEDLGLSCKNCNISHLTEESILKDCMNRDKTIKQIALDNVTTEDEVRKVFLEAMKNYPDHVSNLPEVISFDEVSPYTGEGVFSFVLNDPIHRCT